MLEKLENIPLEPKTVNHDFQKAIDFDKKLREQFVKHDPVMKMEVYLHNSCKPLDEVDFDNDEDKGQQVWDFQSERGGIG